MNYCRGICVRYKPVCQTPSEGRYVNGQKRCQHCEVYIKWDGLYCPCCDNRLRTKPRNKKYKEIFKKKVLLNGTS